MVQIIAYNNNTHQQHFIVKLCASAQKPCVTVGVCAGGGCSINISTKCLRSKFKTKFISKKLSRRSELGKNKLQKLQRSKIHYFSTLSDTMYPEKKSGFFRASSSSQLSQHTDGTYYLVHQHRRHTSHLTVDKKNCPRRHTKTDHRREHESSDRELEYGADAGRWAV